MLLTRRPQSDPTLQDRLDPAFRHPAYEAVLRRCALPLAELGQFAAHIAYGPIVTGRRPPPCEAGFLVVHQGQVAASGVDPRDATVVAPGSPWDRESARLQPGDLVLPRSGEASVAKNRVAVFLGDYPAVVGSFVDRITLSGLDPVYALLCLKSEVVWAQIHRLLNGVGTPNISFDEIRSLRVPLVAAGLQEDIRETYLTRVHAAHLRWLAGDESAGEDARRELSGLLRRLNGLVAPQPQSP